MAEDRGLVVREDHQGLTPLHWAAINDRREVVELLLEQGADPAAKGGVKEGSRMCPRWPPAGDSPPLGGLHRGL